MLLSRLKSLALLVSVSMAAAFAADVSASCTVVVGFDWQPKALGEKFQNPSVACAKRMENAGLNIYSAPPIHLSNTRPRPLNVSALVDQIQKSYPGCRIVGLGYYDIERRDSFFDLDQDRTSTFFPLSSVIRAEMMAVNRISAVGEYSLFDDRLVKKGGPIFSVDPQWNAEVRACAGEGDEVFFGDDRSGGENMCNALTYEITERRAGGFFHISDCSDETARVLSRVIQCLSRGSP